MRLSVLEEKKQRWDRRQANGNEQTWLIISAISATVLGLALTFLT